VADVIMNDGPIAGPVRAIPYSTSEIIKVESGIILMGRSRR
jgi:hypothetical protein